MSVPASNHSAPNDLMVETQDAQHPSSESRVPSSPHSMPSIDTERNTLYSDADSAIGTFSDVSSTTSLRPSIYQNLEENGRTYHTYKEGKYVLPNDEPEKERLELQHTLWGVTFGEKLFFAPIGKNLHNVLDVGTGTGVWAIEFANMFPSAQVVGTDLTPIQPLYVPTNCRFEIDDAEDDWEFSERFDYIHGRALLTCFTDPKQVFTQAFEALSPGGYLELQDPVYPLKYVGPPAVHSDLYRWVELCIEGSTKLGRPWTNVVNYKRWLEEIGFEDVVELNFYMPTNPWAKGKYFKQVGALLRENYMNGVEAMSLRVIGALGWTAEEIREFLVRVKRDIQDPSITCYCPIKVVYGRKPLHTGV